MKVVFWGTRGSLPTANLPTLSYGGNTLCLQVSSARDLLILDAGTGLFPLGKHLMQTTAGSAGEYHILITHTHWDHLQGLPFFLPGWQPGTIVNVYAPRMPGRSLQSIVEPVFKATGVSLGPVSMLDNLRFHELTAECLSINGFSVTTHHLNHPAINLGYRLENQGKTLAYCTDIEPSGYSSNVYEPFRHPLDRQLVNFVSGCQVLVQDAMYNEEQYEQKRGWGHSTAAFAAKVALEAGVPRLILFHHDPQHDAANLEALAASARKLVSDFSQNLTVEIACEGSSLDY